MGTVVRILLAVHQFLPRYFSGTEVLTFEIAKELRRRGHEVHILTAEPASPELARTMPAVDDDVEGFPVHRYHHNVSVSENPGVDEYRNQVIARHVRGYASALRPEVVHVLHCHRLSASILEVFESLGIPRIFTATDFWFVCPVTQLKRHDQSLCRGPSWSGVACLRCCVAQTQPPDIQRRVEQRSDLALWFYTLRHRLAPRRDDGSSRLVRALLQRSAFLRSRLNQVQRIFVATDLMRSILVENGIRPALIRKLAFGLNPEWTRGFTDKQASPGVRFGFVGTIYEHKGAHVLIKAFQAVRDRRGATLRIHGDLTHFPEYACYLRDLAGEDPDIIFAGPFPNQEIGPVLQGLDALVTPSIWHENSPLIILHALDAKTPVIASNVGGLSEHLEHGRNALLFERGDDRQLARLLQEVIDDPSLLPRLRDGIEPVTSIEESVTEIEKTYFEFAKPSADDR